MDSIHNFYYKDRSVVLPVIEVSGESELLTSLEISLTTRVLGLARGPFSPSSDVNSTTIPTLILSNFILDFGSTADIWKKYSCPVLSVINPNPLSGIIRVTVPIVILYSTYLFR